MAHTLDPSPPEDEEGSEGDSAPSPAAVQEREKILELRQTRDRLKATLAAKQALSPGPGKAPDSTPIEESSHEGAGDGSPEPQVDLRTPLLASFDSMLRRI